MPSNEFARRVALTQIGATRISTVLLDCDQYETCIFGGIYENETERYATREDAERGHNAWVGRITREALPRQRLPRE